MVKESDTTAAYRCDNQETKHHRCEAFVPPRPRDRHRLKKGDSRAGYWCRRTAFLAKEVAVATREAREAKEMIQVAQEAHEKQFRKAHEAHEQQFQKVQEQMEEMKQLLATSLKQGVQQFSVAQEQAADTQELLAPLVQQSPPVQATDAQRVQAASRLQAVIRGRCELVTGCAVQFIGREEIWHSWSVYARRLRFVHAYFERPHVPQAHRQMESA